MVCLVAHRSLVALALTAPVHGPHHARLAPAAQRALLLDGRCLHVGRALLLHVLHLHTGCLHLHRAGRALLLLRAGCMHARRTGRALLLRARCLHARRTGRALLPAQSVRHR